MCTVGSFNFQSSTFGNDFRRRFVSRARFHEGTWDSLIWFLVFVCFITPLETNISPFKGIFESMIFRFQRWDMFFLWRVDDQSSCDVMPWKEAKNIRAIWYLSLAESVSQWCRWWYSSQSESQKFQTSYKMMLENIQSRNLEVRWC